MRLHTGRLHCTCFSFFITSRVSNQSSPWQNLIAQDSPAFLRFTHINHINTMHLASTSEDIISLGPQTCLTTRDSKSTKIWRTEGLSRNTIALNCEVGNSCRNWMKPKQFYVFTWARSELCDQCHWKIQLEECFGSFTKSGGATHDATSCLRCQCNCRFSIPKRKHNVTGARRAIVTWRHCIYQWS